MLNTTTEALDFLVKTAQDLDQWDEMPMLMIVHESGKNTLAALAGGDIFEMLATVGPRLKRPGITGLVLTNEGWALKAPVAEIDVLQTVMEELHRTGRRFADDPRAIEVKIFTAIDREGVVGRQIKRGSPVAENAGEDMAGRMVVALKALFREVTA